MSIAQVDSTNGRVNAKTMMVGCRLFAAKIAAADHTGPSRHGRTIAAYGARVRDPKQHQCWAGRWAFNNGNPDWATPCPDAMLVQHVVTDPDTPGVPEILLCNRHYHQVLAQGLITEHDPSPERLADYDRRHRR